MNSEGINCQHLHQISEVGSNSDPGPKLEDQDQGHGRVDPALTTTTMAASFTANTVITQVTTEESITAAVSVTSLSLSFHFSYNC